MKGCYAYPNTGERYAGLVFYGTGGTETEMQDKPGQDQQFRPKGYAATGLIIDNGNCVCPPDQVLNDDGNACEGNAY